MVFNGIAVIGDDSGDINVEGNQQIGRQQAQSLADVPPNGELAEHGGNVGRAEMEADSRDEAGLVEVDEVLHILFGSVRELAGRCRIGRE